jgi:hypothetical protein
MELQQVAAQKNKDPTNFIKTKHPTTNAEHTLTYCSPEQGLPLLGARWCLNGDCGTDLEARLQKAEKAKWELREWWNNKRLPLKFRYKFLMHAMQGTWGWLAGTWTITKTMARELRRSQNHSTRQVARIFRWWNRENWKEYWTRTSRAGEMLRMETDTRRWDHKALGDTWTWAGHVSRLPLDRWAARVTFWRGSFWRRHRRDPQGRLGRPRRGRRKRWDEELERFCQAKWGWPWDICARSMETAEWNEFKDDFAAYAARPKPRTRPPELSQAAIAKRWARILEDSLDSSQISHML